MLHNTGNKNIFAVAYCVNFNLGTHHIFINKHRIFDILCKNNCHIFFDICLVKGDNHILTAKNIRRSEQNRIANFLCNFKSFITSHNSVALWTLYVVFFKKFIKAFSILSHINSVGRCTENFNSVVGKVLCQLNSSLTAKSNNRTNRLFCLYYSHNIFICQWLKI